MPKVKGFVTSYAQEAGLDAQDAHARAQTGNNGAEPGREFKVRKDPNNYRMHPDNNRRMIKRSLRDLGAGRSIVVDNTGASIGGSGVLGEAEALGLPQRIVETDGSELVVVVRKDMGPDDPRRKLLALADNATTDQSEWDVEALQAQADKARLVIDERLLTAYGRIRSNVRNGLAVVPVKRDACGGCFNRIPPQRQSEIRQGKRIIICEYCGRILVHDDSEE